MMKCKDCKFWEEKKTDNDKVVQGFCHCNPPTATGVFVPKMNMITGQAEAQLVELTIWPRPKPNGWCGKFEEKVN